MIPRKRTQKGQALILIAMAMFGTIGLIALAIDGGNAYADRRQAQNASDAAAVALSMRYAQDQTLTSTYFNQYLTQKTTENGYTGTLPRSQVTLVVTDAAPGDCTNNSIGKYFQVEIDSTMPTWFGNIVGISQVHNHVASKALGCPPVVEPAYNGTAIVALNKTTCQALKISGTSSTVITSSTNQGIFVNSTCLDAAQGPQNALYGGSGTMSAPSVKVVGGVYGASVFAPTSVQTGVPPTTKNYIWPTITAADCGGTSQVVNGNTLTPGTFPGTNTSWKSKDFPPQGITTLEPGLYCLDNDFKTTSTSNTNLTGSEVLIYQRNGIISIQGGKINLSAQTSGFYKGLLFYMPFSNTGGSITINGNGDSTYFGSIVAPGAPVTLNGGGSTTGPFQTQVIADTVTLGGNGNLSINYNSSTQYQPPISAGVQLVK